MSFRVLPVLSLLALAVAVPASAKRPAPAGPTPPTLEEGAATVLGRALLSDEAYTELVELCDTIGHRLAGSPALEKAVAWGQEQMQADGLSVHTEPVEVPTWIRGEEHLWTVGDRARELPMLALGGSVGTPKEGLEADVLVVSDFAELEAKADEAKGKIVVYDAPFTSYGETVEYRWAGPEAAAKHGAVAALVRSITSKSLNTPHTGTTHFEDESKAIPAAAITVEDATWLHRLQDAGFTTRLKLQMEAHMEADRMSANVVGELPGRERKDEVVLLGCHLDSWDVGTGAQDDGAGCVAVMDAAAVIASLPTRPRRGIRVVLFTNEENGLRGGKAYGESHANDGVRIVAAIEADTGSGRVKGFNVDANTGDEEGSKAESERIIGILEPYRHLLAPIGADSFQPGHSGADVGPLTRGGVLGFGLHQDTTDYWPIHHTWADTVEKVDPKLLRENVAALAVLAWVLAEAQEVPKVTPKAAP